MILSLSDPDREGEPERAVTAWQCKAGALGGCGGGPEAGGRGSIARAERETGAEAGGEGDWGEGGSKAVSRVRAWRVTMAEAVCGVPGSGGRAAVPCARARHGDGGSVRGNWGREARRQASGVFSIHWGSKFFSVPTYTITWAEGEARAHGASPLGPPLLVCFPCNCTDVTFKIYFHFICDKNLCIICFP